MSLDRILKDTNLFISHAGQNNIYKAIESMIELSILLVKIINFMITKKIY